ncbi:insulin-induced gene 1 protein isoform X1 [Equus quagga]|uniref:insulin-induced gene 1 protein isoform X1 n=1 Tax=Equus quagga TaxID=89248 RepID=UPI001EE15EB7|nr:insulin-induced gene 1 protein isoform X1 [Equus quagga]XP_046525178.1 insulin-induced gene 1 protein isoform X1 [Equus quagga]
MPRLDDHFWSCSCAKGRRHRSHQRTGSGGVAAKVGKMINSSVPGPSLLVAHSAPDTDPSRGPQSTGVGGRGGSSCHTNSWHHHLVQRSLVLFSVGVVLALVLNLLQVQRNVTLFPEEVIATIFSSAWWVPPCCGTAAAVVGLLYPCIDSHLGEPHKFKREWASVMRCVAVFVGINHASAKLDFANNVQLSLTLAALSLGLWWTFDRSRSGLGLGITIAFLATLITQLLVYNGVYQYTSPDFLYIRSWLPCIFFSGGVTVGNIGRQLAMVAVLSCHQFLEGCVSRGGVSMPTPHRPHARLGAGEHLWFHREFLKSHIVTESSNPPILKNDKIGKKLCDIGL